MSMKQADRVKQQVLNLVAKSGQMDSLVQIEIAQHLMAGVYSIMTRVKLASRKKRQQLIGLQKNAKVKTMSK